MKKIVLCLFLSVMLVQCHAEGPARDGRELLSISEDMNKKYPDEITQQDVENVKKFLDKNQNVSLKTLFSDKKILKSWIPNKEFLAYPFLGILGAVAYGIIHDQCTARICLEYFTTKAVPHHQEAMEDKDFIVNKALNSCFA